MNKRIDENIILKYCNSYLAKCSTDLYDKITNITPEDENI